MRNYTIIVLLFLELTLSSHGIGNINAHNWKLLFPAGSGIGLFLALAIPLDLPNKNVFVAYNFEANYDLPPINTTKVDYPPILAKNNGRNAGIPEEQTPTHRGIDRKLVYEIMESKFNSRGYPGRACLLRIICETTLHPITVTNGVLGDIFHIIFTPTSSKNNGLAPDYERAEKYGRKMNECTAYHKKCTISFLDLISWIGYYL